MDDASDMSHLKEDLETYMAQYPKVLTELREDNISILIMFAGEDSAVPGASGTDPRPAAGCGQVHGGGAHLPRLPHRVHGGLARAAAGQDRQELVLQTINQR